MFGKSQLKNVSVSDTRGVFLTSPEIDLDWSPGAWLSNKLHIDSVTADRVTLVRLPKLKPSARRGKILPGFDIHIGELAIKRLEIGPQVSGQPRSGTLRGKADIRSGRALVELAASLDNGGDRIALKLDAEPDRDKFDVEARVISPANGVIPALVGTRRAIGLSIAGNGSWTRWRGKAALDLSGQPAARLALGVDSGRYRLTGKWDADQFLTGKFQRLTSPMVDVSGDATLKDRILDGQLIARLAGASRGRQRRDQPRRQQLSRDGPRHRPAQAAGIVPQHDRQEHPHGVDARRPVRDRRLFLPADLAPRSVRRYWLRSTCAPRGAGRLTPWPMRVPIRLQAKAITGIGDVAGAMLANPKIEGWLTITPKLVRGEDLKLTSAKWNGKLSLLIDLVTGRFEVLLSGAMQRYLIPGLGIVDVITDLKVVPGPNNKGSHVVGTAKAWVRRLDNSFFRDLTGGLPSLTTNLERGNDNIVHFTQFAALLAQAQAVGGGAALPRRHLPHRRFRPPGEIRAGQADPRRAYRAAAARPAARPAQ